MSEETTEVGEAETPSSEEVVEVSEVIETETKVYTQEEVDAITKKMQSDSEKGVQKLISKQKAYESVLEVVGKVSENQAYLVECYESNPEVAQIILEKYYNGQSIDEFKKTIGYEIDYNDPATRQKYFEMEAQRIADKKMIDKTTSDFIEKLKMTDKEKKDFEEALDERKQLKSFRSSDIEKHLEKAYREISDNTEVLKTLKSQETIAKAMVTGEGKGGSEPQKKSGLQNEISDFLKLHS